MKPIKFISVIVIATTIFYSCQPDKKAQLAKLVKQHDQLSEKIKNLEDEIAKTDTTVKVVKTTKVIVAQLKPETFKHYIEVQGKLDGEDNVDVFPESQGVITEVYVKAGQAVSKGHALAAIDNGPVRDQLKSLETQYKFTKETFEKQQTLWDQKIGSEIQYLQIKSQKEALESQLASVRKQLDMMTIKAPITGTVEEVNVKTGQFASPAIPTPLFRVLNFGSIKVKAEVAEAYSKKVNVGDEVQIYFPDLDKEITAKISAASRFISPTNRSFIVEARLSAEKIGYKANMVAVLKITDYKVDNAVVIPVNYIQNDPSGTFVYIIENKNNATIASKSYISQGQSYNGIIEITKGLKVGDKVITSGYLDLEVGEAVSF